MSNLDTLLAPFLSNTSQQGNQVGAAAQGTQTSGLANLVSGPNGLVTGLIGGGLAGVLLGGKSKPKKMAKTALKVGGVALVGGLAYVAWQNWRNGQQPAASSAQAPVSIPQSGHNPFLPQSGFDEMRLARKLVRAMLAAANADGHITPAEQFKIGGKIREMGIRDEDQSLIMTEISKPLRPEDIAKNVEGIEEAAEIYLASYMIVYPEGQAEKAYLDRLAHLLGLDTEFVAHLQSVATADADTSPSPRYNAFGEIRQ